MELRPFRCILNIHILPLYLHSFRALLVFVELFINEPVSDASLAHSRLPDQDDLVVEVGAFILQVRLLFHFINIII